MRQYLENPLLQNLVATFRCRWPIAAIWRGVQLAALGTSSTIGYAVLFGRTTLLLRTGTEGVGKREYRFFLYPDDYRA